MKKWEYLTEIIKTKGVFTKIDADEFNQTLNDFGKEGWELIDKTPVAMDLGRTASVVCVFKREIV